MSVPREQWSSKMGFVMAAVGSAVGLGNIWRYPYLAYASGGGAFLIPYFFALFTAGIPLMILEQSFGHRFKGSPPMALAKASRKWEWLGWWPAINSLVILIYYSAILAWVLNYIIFAFTQAWGQDANTFFFEKFLKLSPGIWPPDGFRWPILVALSIIWLLNWFIVYTGVTKGIERLNKVLLPTLVIIILVIVIKGVTLPGATLGLNKLLNPDWSKIMDPKVWIAAYGQIFFSLSLAMGVMMTYASYLPKKTDINNTAFMTCFANSGFEFLAALGIFSVLGYMASATNTPVDQVVKESIGLAFVAFPTAIGLLPGILKTVFGVLFFTGLLFAGLTSSVSMIEAFTSSVIDKTGTSRKKIVSYAALLGFFISTFWATGIGLYLLDIVDHFINAYGTTIIGLLEAILVGWILKIDMRSHVNEISYFRIGKWWEYCIKYITPLVLIYMLSQNIWSELVAPYGDYPRSAVLLLGWMVVGIIVVISIVISSKNWHNPLEFAAKDGAKK